MAWVLTFFATACLVRFSGVGAMDSDFDKLLKAFEGSQELQKKIEEKKEETNSPPQKEEAKVEIDKAGFNDVMRDNNIEYIAEYINNLKTKKFEALVKDKDFYKSVVLLYSTKDIQPSEEGYTKEQERYFGLVMNVAERAFNLNILSVLVEPLGKDEVALPVIICIGNNKLHLAVTLVDAYDDYQRNILFQDQNFAKEIGSQKQSVDLRHIFNMINDASMKVKTEFLRNAGMQEQELILLALGMKSRKALGKKIAAIDIKFIKSELDRKELAKLNQAAEKIDKLQKEGKGEWVKKHTELILGSDDPLLENPNLFKTKEDTWEFQGTGRKDSPEYLEFLKKSKPLFEEVEKIMQQQRKLEKERALNPQKTEMTPQEIAELEARKELIKKFEEIQNKEWEKGDPEVEINKLEQLFDELKTRKTGQGEPTIEEMFGSSEPQSAQFDQFVLALHSIAHSA